MCPRYDCIRYVRVHWKRGESNLPIDIEFTKRIVDTIYLEVRWTKDVFPLSY